MIKERLNDFKTLQRSHKCSCIDSNTKSCYFCKDCGLLIKETLFTQKKAYRPEHYNFPNPYRLDQSSILTNMIRKQDRNRFFNPKCYHLQFRLKLVNWLKENTIRFKFQKTTFHLACCIIDTVFSLFEVDEKRIKLITFMSLYIAVKVEDKDKRLPSLERVTELFDFEFKIEEFEKCEKRILKILNYNLNIQIPLKFVSYFMYRGVIYEDDFEEDKELPCADGLMEKLVYYTDIFVEASLMNYDLYEFTPQAIAAAVIACSRKQMGIRQIWNEQLENLTRMKWVSIEDCVDLLEETAFEFYPEKLEDDPVWLTPVKKKKYTDSIKTNDGSGGDYLRPYKSLPSDPRQFKFNKLRI